MAERFYSDSSASGRVRGTSALTAFVFTFLERAALLAGLKIVADRLYAGPAADVRSLVVANGVYALGMVLLSLWVLFNVTPAILFLERTLEPKWAPRWLRLMLTVLAVVIALTVAWELKDALQAFVSELSKEGC